MTHPRIGVWLIGAKGGIASTTIIGLAALQRGLVEPTGLVSQLPAFQHLSLPGWSDLVLGGHEIRKVPLCQEAMRVATDMRATSPEVVRQCQDDLNQIEQRIRPGTLYRVGATIASLADMDPLVGASSGEAAPLAKESARQAVDRLKADLRDFLRATNVEHLVVVNVASTEPRGDMVGLPATWAELEPLLSRPDCPLPASSLYAIAALDAGASYINFTPSLGSDLPAIDDLARRRAGRHYGCDGKTGETLLKSVLAPMFAARNLQVMSWVSHNIFGNMDGQVLNDPVNKQAKLVSKDRLLQEILGYRPQTHISIEYIESMGDWKTAWDHIHFAGFLGTPMTMQFTWQGCDSVLAAPLVIDLVRFTVLAWQRGETGLMRFLASFFKSPLGVTEHRFDRQFQMLELEAWARQ